MPPPATSVKATGAVHEEGRIGGSAGMEDLHRFIEPERLRAGPGDDERPQNGDGDKPDDPRDPQGRDEAASRVARAEGTGGSGLRWR